MRVESRPSFSAWPRLESRDLSYLPIHLFIYIWSRWENCLFESSFETDKLRETRPADWAGNQGSETMTLVRFQRLNGESATSQLVLIAIAY